MRGERGGSKGLATGKIYGHAGISANKKGSHRAELSDVDRRVQFSSREIPNASSFWMNEKGRQSGGIYSEPMPQYIQQSVARVLIKQLQIAETSTISAQMPRVRKRTISYTMRGSYSDEDWLIWQR